MAKANLTVDAALLSAFASADATSTDYFALRVDGTTITAASSGSLGGGAPDALWSVLSSQASELLAAAAAAPPPGTKAPLIAPRPEPRIWVVRAPGVAGAWLLVGFTPESVHPRQKMLYASARDDVRRAVGPERFVVGDYFTTAPDELSARAFADFRRRDATEAMSAREIAVRAVEREVAAERATAGPMRMAIAPAAFTADAELSAAAARIAARDADVGGWLEIRVGADAAASALASPTAAGAAGAAASSLSLVASGVERSAGAMAARIAAPDATEPRFYLHRPETAAAAAEAAAEGDAAQSPPLLLIYHCPEGAKPKARMAYSTAKNSLIKALGDGGHAPTKTVRILS
jgi:hypothetical protein